jgi:tripartite-type tricarboxylate transporter receptor subunit TctC
MKLPHRRSFLHLAAGAVVLPATSCVAWAQAYPTRPVRIIVGYAAGGGTDISARVVGQWLSERLNQQFVIENRPGAATNIATEAMATRCCSSLRPMRSTRRTMRSSISTSFRTLRRLQPSCGFRWSWWSIRRFRQ